MSGPTFLEDGLWTSDIKKWEPVYCQRDLGGFCAQVTVARGGEKALHSRRKWVIEIRLKGGLFSGRKLEGFRGAEAVVAEKGFWIS